MFKEPSQPLHPTDPVLSQARLYPSFLEDGERFACILVLLGKETDSAQLEALSWEKHAHPQSPPTFLWHTAEDAAVPVENSYLMAMALQQNKTPHELHVFPQGAHGLGLCSIDFRRQAGAAQWRVLAQRWLLELGF